MSRGLGARQRLMLGALRRLEDAHGIELWFPVVMIMDAAWDEGLQGRGTARFAAREAELQAWREQQAAEEAADRLAAVGGDAAAKRRVDDRDMMHMIEGVSRGGRQHVDRFTLRRNNPEAEDMLNPSHVLASLERRGMVRRYARAARLTEAGRVLVPASPCN